MTTSLIVGLAAWAILATFFLIRTIRGSSRQRNLHRRLSRLIGKLPADKQFEALLSSNDAYEKLLPWFQRSLSTLGVIAFFSMSAAALTQTISAQLSEFKASAAERRYSYIQDTARITDISNARSSQAILAMIASGMPRMPEMDAFLRARLAILIDPRRPDDSVPQDASESIAIALGLGEANCAAQIWRNHPNVDLTRFKLSQSDTLAFSKLLHYLGNDARALALLDKVPGRHSLSTEHQIAALRYVLRRRDAAILERSTLEVSQAFRIPTDEVRRGILRWARTIGEEKASLLLSRSVDFCKDPGAQEERT